MRKYLLQAAKNARRAYWTALRNGDYPMLAVHMGDLIRIQEDMVSARRAR